MGRRNQGAIINAIFVASSLPWWICILLAIVSYYVLNHFANIQNPPVNFTKNMGQYAGNQLFIIFFGLLKFVVPFILTAGAFVSVFNQTKRKRLYSSVAHTAPAKRNYFGKAIFSFFDQGKSKCLHSSTMNTIPVEKNYYANSQYDPISSAPPNCPLCLSVMVERTARKGKWAGKTFWGCPNFPRCKGIVHK